MSPRIFYFILFLTKHELNLNFSTPKHKSSYLINNLLKIIIFLGLIAVLTP